MYLINKEDKKLSKVLCNSFSKLALQERYDLQEWVVNHPEIFSEELLIIQKEFDGFDGTRERLDVLALDKNGNIVVIENKGDDTGRNVIWQNLKYVSYCSTLTKQQILDIYQLYLDKFFPNEKAIDNLKEFYEVEDLNELILNEDQRMFFVALDYRKEVTSSAMWLLNKGIDVKCFKVSLYEISHNLLIDIEQIIPVKEAEDYIISMTNKVSDASAAKKRTYEIYNLRYEYWSSLLPLLHSSKTELYKDVNPSKNHWLNCRSGIEGLSYNLLSGVDFVGVELKIEKATLAASKAIFDELLTKKDIIETSFGDALQWNRLDDKKVSRIVYSAYDVSIKNRDDWMWMQSFQIEHLEKLEAALTPYLYEEKNS